MVQTANPILESMGHSALDGNAIVTVKDGKSVVDLKFKGCYFKQSLWTFNKYVELSNC